MKSTLHTKRLLFHRFELLLIEISKPYLNSLDAIDFILYNTILYERGQKHLVNTGCHLYTLYEFT